MPALNNEDRGHTRHPASRLEAEKREAGDGANPKTTLMVRGTRQRDVLDKWRSPLEERREERSVNIYQNLGISHIQLRYSRLLSVCVTCLVDSNNVTPCVRVQNRPRFLCKEVQL